MSILFLFSKAFIFCPKNAISSLILPVPGNSCHKKSATPAQTCQEKSATQSKTDQENMVTPKTLSGKVCNYSKPFQQK